MEHANWWSHFLLHSSAGITQVSVHGRSACMHTFIAEALSWTSGNKKRVEPVRRSLYWQTRPSACIYRSARSAGRAWKQMLWMAPAAFACASAPPS